MALGQNIETLHEDSYADQEEQRKDIIEDIYNILYTPLSNYREQEEPTSLCFNDRFFLKKSVLTASNIHQNPEKPEEKDKNDSESGRTVKNENIQYQYATFKKKDGEEILQKSKNLLDSTEIKANN